MSKTSFLDDLCLANFEEKENKILNNIKTNLRFTPNIMFHYTDFREKFILNIHFFLQFNKSNIHVIDIRESTCNIKKLTNKYYNYITWVKETTDNKDYIELRKTHTIDYCMFSYFPYYDGHDFRPIYLDKLWDEQIYTTDLKINTKQIYSYVIKEFVALKNKNNNNLITSFYLHVVFKTNKLDKNNIIEKDIYLLITQTSLFEISKTYPKILFDNLLKAIKVKDLVSIIIKYVQNLNIKNDNEVENKSTFYI